MTDQQILADWFNNHRPQLMTDDERRVYNDWIEFAKHYHQVKSVDLAEVGGSYRMLKEGEKIQVGDEFIDNNGKWRLSGRFYETYTKNDYYPHRRLM